VPCLGFDSWYLMMKCLRYPRKVRVDDEFVRREIGPCRWKTGVIPWGDFGGLLVPIEGIVSMNLQRCEGYIATDTQLFG
jgi:hypothetical protein